jgi:cobyrinic acid a,c-diamide synthase
MSAPGIVITSPSANSGKTATTLALIGALRLQGLVVRPFKTGADKHDSKRLANATALPCDNLDSWAMRIETLSALGDDLAKSVDLVIGEGRLGMFDGALIEQGSTADLASLFDLPVILVVDAEQLQASAAALVAGFIHHREDVDVAGIIFNNVASEAHADNLKRACDDHFSQPVIGSLPKDPRLRMPKAPHDPTSYERFLDGAAEVAVKALDLDQFQRLARPFGLGLYGPSPCPLRPLGQRIAVAEDSAFAPAYHAILEGWRRAGANILPFSPLADAAPCDDADAVYLPGFNKESAGELETCETFLNGLGHAAARSAFVYAEGSSFAILGSRLVDRDSKSFRMADLLPITTRFDEKDEQSLGYRSLILSHPCPLGPAGTAFRGYGADGASIVEMGGGCQTLFEAKDPRGRGLGAEGLIKGSVAGSFVDLIDRVAEPSDGDFRLDPIRLVRD